MWSAPTQTAQWAHKSIIATDVGLYRAEGAARVVTPSSSFSFDGWIVEEVWHASAYHPANPCQHPGQEYWSLPLLDLNS